MYRTGYHFRAAIVDDARALVGETVVSTITPGQVEPIPETQEEINKQADAAIRDLFPRIPNTDRTMIIEHAFKKVSSRNHHMNYANKIRVLYSMVSQLLDFRTTFLYLAEFNLPCLLILDILILDMTNSLERHHG
jgi:hypothetical protein